MEQVHQVSSTHLKLAFENKRWLETRRAYTAIQSKCHCRSDVFLASCVARGKDAIYH
jgi:hypothetical protein